MPTASPTDLDTQQNSVNYHNYCYELEEYESIATAMNTNGVYGTCSGYGGDVAAEFVAGSDPVAADATLNNLGDTTNAGPVTWITSAAGTNYCGGCERDYYSGLEFISQTNSAIINGVEIQPDAGYNYLAPYAINASGAAAGQEFSDYSTNASTVLHQNGTNTFLPGSGIAFALNNLYTTNVTAGSPPTTNVTATPQIVGDNYSGSFPYPSAALWDQTYYDGTPSTNYIVKNLSQLVPGNGTNGPPWQNLVLACGINNGGAIIVQEATYSGSNTNIAPGPHGLLLIPDSIQRDGQSITTNNNTVVVGQQINLTNMISGMPTNAVTSYHWVIPGANNTTNDTAFYDYEPSVTNSCYTNLFTPTNYTTNNYCNFYWSSGASNQVVYCTNVIYGQTNTVSATFNVVGPTNTGISVAEGTIGINSTQTRLAFGQLIAGSPPAGMVFTPTYTSPSGFAGTNAWIQLLPATNRTAVWVYPTQTVTSGATGGNDAIRLQTNFYYPYSEAYPSDDADDSPAGYLPASATNVSRYFDATMYLMWKPYSTNSLVNGDHTVWVPLRSYHWNWSGVATNGTPTASWGLMSSSLPNHTDTNVIVNQEPTWTSTNTHTWSTNTP